MTIEQILETLPHLSFDDRNKVLDKLSEIIQSESIKSKELQKQQMRLAALEAIEDYLPGSDLLAFDEIEGEDFYDYENKGSELTNHA
ncbi:hypothetical protein [Leptolyngbya sp. NIES-2104]|uniref:hypothetical protein n=1 Tax=Leptolyngbya sp. NIES-2104 TaxID=1552121 RepID=UPI0006ECCABE|nr:hypothetical protein [Leptolyngbya sp. NIES-2104]GAP98587.1 prevent host death protein, Phd antitoxin [Leptolyngbya sp. NIES-2104]